MPRLHALDSLRGIAALLVMIEHSSLLIPSAFFKALPLQVYFSPLSLFINGRMAVLLFFILSGYVLALPYTKNRALPYIPFLMKRIARIYIPFFFAVLFAAALYYASPIIPKDLVTNKIYYWWPPPPLTPAIVLRHLAMTGIIGDMALDSPIWSVIYEMRVSIIFPLLVFLCRDWKDAAFAGVFFTSAALLLALANENGANLSIAHTAMQSLAITIFYTPVFMLGIVLAKYDAAIGNWLNHLSGRMRAILLLLVIGAFCLPPDLYFTHSNQPLLVYEYASGLIFCITAAFLIAAARHMQSFKTYLSAAPLQWLGKISYSFYLVHVPLILFLSHALADKVSLPVLLALIYAVTLITAAIFNRFIEQPAMRLRHYLARRALTTNRYAVRAKA